MRGFWREGDVGVCGIWRERESFKEVGEFLVVVSVARSLFCSFVI